MLKLNNLLEVPDRWKVESEKKYVFVLQKILSLTVFTHSQSVLMSIATTSKLGSDF